MDDVALHRLGVNRLGNVLVPNESYGIVLEKKLQPMLRDLWKEGRKSLSTKELLWEFGRRTESRDSLLWGPGGTASRCTSRRSSTGPWATTSGPSGRRPRT